MKNQKGFSLIELLVVVIIIGIIAAIAIPSLLSSRRAAREASAAANLRTLVSAQATYQATTGGGNTFATDFGAGATQLGSLVDAGFPTKGTYTYDITATATANGYCINADSSDAGDKHYAVSDAGAIYYNPTAAISCANGAIVTNGAGTLALGD